MFKKKKDDQQGKNTASATGKKELTDEELGKRAGALYHEAMAEISKLLGSKPDISLIRQPIYDLKERIINELVSLGKTREARDAQRRQKIDAMISNALMSVNMSHFQAFQDAVTFYRPKDNDLANTIAKFNIITQYANFDLLKKQEPKEAERLGIK
jgi:hypothetical protein